jgi:hypothetical protein
VLVRANHRLEVVEIELTRKRDRTEYDRKLNWYLRPGALPPSALVRAQLLSLRDRLRRVAREIHMDDFVRVAPLPPYLDYQPGIKADRQPSKPVSVRRLDALPQAATERWRENPAVKRQQHS